MSGCVQTSREPRGSSSRRLGVATEIDNDHLTGRDLRTMRPLLLERGDGLSGVCQRQTAV